MACEGNTEVEERKLEIKSGSRISVCNGMHLTPIHDKFAYITTY